MGLEVFVTVQPPLLFLRARKIFPPMTKLDERTLYVSAVDSPSQLMFAVPDAPTAQLPVNFMEPVFPAFLLDERDVHVAPFFNALQKAELAEAWVLTSAIGAVINVAARISLTVFIMDISLCVVRVIVDYQTIKTL